ncbi:hypothetical protein KX928_23590 [Roseobacter sp. YSTF-M11]|uniref:Ig-like domain-containing protein n=1 Tax=Roseobacter insulae TaxID=2859783 RepID=A0A9X1G162_9RHOB|nr:hypothetical protein [Roseobacter insulae]MBW4710785.1 hypothetical protein [Roseobacter insulae]
MTGIAVGCSLAAPNIRPGPMDVVPPPPPAVLSVVQPLTASSLYEGQTLQDISGFSTLTNLGNFTSSVGTITQAVVVPEGDAGAVDTPLAEGSMAGFSVDVTDDAGTQRRFSSDLTAVEFKSRLVATAGNEAQVELNPLVPDSESLEIVISGGTDYDGTYQPTAGNLRQLSPYHFAGTTRITHAGLAADLAAGMVLTVLEGLFTSTTGILNFSYQWYRDGTAIGGAASKTYTLAAADTGASITCTVTAQDGTNPVTLVTSSAVTISAQGLTALRLFDPLIVQASRNSYLFPAADLSAVPAGTPLYISATSRDNASTYSVVSLTVDGQPATAVTGALSDSGSARIMAGFWKMARPASGICDIAINYSEGIASGIKLTVFAVPNATGEFATSNGRVGGLTELALDLDTQAGSVVLTAFVDEGGGILNWTGVGNISSQQDASARNHATAFTTVASAQTPAATRIATTSGTQKAGSAICIV